MQPRSGAFHGATRLPAALPTVGDRCVAQPIAERGMDGPEQEHARQPLESPLVRMLVGMLQ